ncbi:MAG: hypothetical protein ACRYGB_13675 [Janthinobacterium lividum]
MLLFFLLDQKEPKNQDKPDPSGRFVRRPHLRGDLANGSEKFCRKVDKRSMIEQFKNQAETYARLPSKRARLNAARRRFGSLEFLVLFIRAKRTVAQATAGLLT